MTPTKPYTPFRLTIATFFVSVLTSFAVTDEDPSKTEGNPLFPFPDRLPSVFSALDEKANS
ncbi:MAG: hypothetical protein O3C21_11240 [Verrucomicrobia bacterium]|nr:hypothetical protein [Verrucomicrobiota bacterium]